MNGSNGAVAERLRNSSGSDRGEKEQRDKRITQNSLLAKVEMQGYKCALTGWELTPEVASVDHITPLKDGGEHNIDNVHVVHCDANAAKGTLPMADFLNLCRAVAAKHPGPDAG